MRWRGRIEESAPGIVLFALAATVVMITAGIVFVLFESGSKFYRGFACGADSFTPPQDWDEDLKASIKDAAIYDDGKISDPLWLDSFCIVDWDMEHMVVLSDPMIDTYGWDPSSETYTDDSDREGSAFQLADGTIIVGPRLDSDRSYLSEYYDQNPEHWDDEYPKIPLQYIADNENALILHKQDPELAREWWVTVWVGDDSARLSMEDYQVLLPYYENNTEYNKNDEININQVTLCHNEGQPILQQLEDEFVTRGVEKSSNGCFTIEQYSFFDYQGESISRFSSPSYNFSNEVTSYIFTSDFTTGGNNSHQDLLDNLRELDIKDLPFDYDNDGVANEQVDGAGKLLDNDIDGDGITNNIDEDIDSDGLPNAYDPNPYTPDRDYFGLLLGVITILVVALTIFSPRWLVNIPVERIDLIVPVLRTNFAFLATISTMSMLVPPSLSIILLVSALSFILTFFGWKLDGKLPYSTLSLGIFSLLISFTSFYFIQIGHTIALCVAVLMFTKVINDSRNQSGSNKFAIVDSDSKLAMNIAVIVTILLMYLDVVARVNGSLGEFFTQTWWKTDITTVGLVTVDSNLHMGVNSLLQTTLQVALGALVIAIPVGLGTAIFLSEYASPRVANIVKPILELLAGIPSVVYGFFAFVVIAPIVVDIGTSFLERGWISQEPQLFNPLNGAIVVGIMITPLIASLSEDALRAVPDNLRQASYALGATPTETTARVTIPSALSGILASIILALSRAIGETMAVTLSVGTLAVYSDNMFRSAQTMTAYIAQRIGGELPIGTTPYYSLFAVGLYLFVITLSLNLVGHRIMTRFREEYD